ncbi:hypothetical protein CTA1_7187 [Colletotrichum tanaceti]|uniref:NAD-specific glutamate dehydrogenase n=1 Tax=Colletotrichum tanaceti TaxID=1306861 RepID=A0A4U6X202_9PEZI|nr:hypothetical protein CTA1_7187 [Colletotrichum tanaceti]
MARNDRGKVVVHQHDGRSLLGDLGTGDTHREPNVRSLERGRIVGTVTSHGDGLAESLEAGDQDTLVLGRGTGQDLQTGQGLVHLLDGELAEDGALHDESALGENTTLGRDSLSGDGVVTGHHTDDHAGVLGLANRLGDSGADGVLNTDNTGKDEVVEDVAEFDVSLDVGMNTVGRPLRVVLADEGDGAKRLLGVGVDGSLEEETVGFFQGGSAEVGDVELLCAVSEENLRGALDDETVAAVVTGQLDDGGHAFLARVKGHHLHDLLVGAGLGQSLHAEVVLGELEQGGLGLGADKGGLAVLLSLKGGGVDGDGLDEELLGGLGKRLGEFDGAGDLLAVDRLGEAGGAKGAGDDRHLVRGQGAGLVGADGRGVAHRLAGSEDANQVVLLQEASRGESQRKSHSQRKPLGHGDDDDGDGHDENVHEAGRLLGASAAVVGQVGEEADEEDDEEEEGGAASELGNGHGQALELLLQRRGLHLGANRHHDLAEAGVGADRGADEGADALEDLGSRDDERVDVLGSAAGLEGVEDGVAARLLESVRLTRGRGLVALQVMAADEDAVDRDQVAGLEVDDIANQDLGDVDHEGLARPDDLDLAVFLLGVELDKGAFFLPVIEGSDQRNDQDGNNNSNALHPVDRLAVFGVVFDAKGLVQAER